MSGDQYSTRLDGKDRRKLERYRDQYNVSKAEALRHGVRELERDGSDTDPDLVDRLETVIHSWGTVLTVSIAFLILSETGILPDVVQILAGALLLPALGFSWYVTYRE
jgi:hypothetical protein